MSYPDRIAECNRHDPALYAPFFVAGARVGLMRRDRIAALAGARGLERMKDGGARLAPEREDPAGRGEALNALTHEAAGRGLCAPPRGESFPVGRRFGEILCEVDRAGVELFGFPSWGVHMNGCVETASGPALWIPRRAAGMIVCPGALDNMVAGGQPAGVGVRENLAKEAGEEAGIPAELARRATPAGAVSYVRDGPHGARRTALFVFDLAVPADFAPRNRDGEVGSFALLPVAEVMRRVAETRAFKFDSALVLVDFFVRRGLIAPEDPDYLDVCAGLRRRIP